MSSYRPPIDLNRARHVSARITWAAEVYQHYIGGHPAIEPPWRCLPFDIPQLDKLPPRSGLYAITYKYQCLGFTEQEIVMYIGEADNLQSRFVNEYKAIATSNPVENTQSANPKRRQDRLQHLFTKFDNLLVHYCTTEASQEERRSVERELIGLLDPHSTGNAEPS